MGLNQGAFTCDGWQVTLCDPIWQVTSCKCEMGVPLEAIHSFTFFNHRCTAALCTGPNRYSLGLLGS